MESVEIKLPDRVVQLFRQRSEESESSLEELITDILVDHAFFSMESSQAARVGDGAGMNRNEIPPQLEPKTVLGEGRGGAWQTGDGFTEQEKSSFSVASKFSSAERMTIQQAQQFVDAALDYRGVKAFKNDGGIGFDPNFVFIERVYTKEVGFAASFYGPPSAFDDYHISMLPGRGNSYSRLKVKSDQDLKVALKALHISAHLKSLERNG